MKWIAIIIAMVVFFVDVSAESFSQNGQVASTANDAKHWIDASISPTEVANQRSQHGSISSEYSGLENEPAQNNTVNMNSMANNEYGSTSYGWNRILLICFMVAIFAIFKGAGDDRTIIIFRDYNDLGLTFLVPVSGFLIYFFFVSFGGNIGAGMWLGFIVALIFFGILVRNTYEDNQGSFLYTLLAILTKVPLAFMWVINFVTMLNPSGKTQRERRKNRNSAMVILAFLTPIIGMLVANKEGSLFNPRDWIKGRRIGNIRNHL